jgi:predicted ATP-grasp superfamily ATP-dependent carboligase
MPKHLDKTYPPVVVVGLNDAALSIVRSLGRKGLRIIGFYDDNAHDYYIRSKYCSVKLKRPLYGESLVDALINDVANNLKEPAVLFCTNDNTVLTVSKYEDQLKPFFKFVLPPYEATNGQISKREFHRFAQTNSFLVPNTFFTKGAEEIEKVAEIISFPCVIKPEFRDRTWDEKVPVKVLYAESKQDFLNLIGTYQIQQTSLVIQEWIDGDDSEVYFCLSYINRNHKPLAICVARKLRQYPHLTGSTSIAKTVWVPEIAVESLRLLNTVGCVGFCSVEFKQSRKDGRFYVTEPTIGRPDTQEGICISAGLDIPWIAYLDAISQDLSPLGRFEEGIKWINEPLEFSCLQKYFRNGVDLKKFLSIYKGRRSYALWAVDDPIPALTFLREKMNIGLFKLLKLVFYKNRKI